MSIIKSKETTTKNAQHNFTDEELLAIGKTLSLKNKELKELEDRKKAVGSQFKSEMDACSAEINLLSNQVQNGWCMKNFKCHVVRDFNTGYKLYVDVESGEVVAKEKLTAEDHQMNFDDEEQFTEILELGE